MEPVFVHPWNLTPKQAIDLQKELAGQVCLDDEFRPFSNVCGLDVSYSKHNDLHYAVAALLSFPELELIELAHAASPSPFPYVPGLLSFREIPVLVKALAKLSRKPDLLACDGQGYAHPRRFGLACHLGVFYDRPAIGLAKSRLVGSHAQPGPNRGQWAWLFDGDDHIGQVLRTRDNVAPLFVSPGHRMGFHTARKIALALCPQWRLPETTRVAHRKVNRIRREDQQKK